ncbi:MAG: asparagine synthase (glutamine-hydrolyzing) [Anaerolineae bacterium]|nr:asparagine synthase (glutamine-hydrolyzing) [Anaerolineae bacterium]
MCGITGIWRLDGGPIDPVCVEQAAGLMRHRGPDDEGYWLAETSSGRCALRGGADTPPEIGHDPLSRPLDFQPDLALAHRRLAIIDLSPGGHEPLTTVGGDLWLTFNGEIYNYLELRDELKALGCAFHTEGDGEVILQAYRTWGLACLERFIGMFAFALYDLRRRRLWLARDRFGIKPLYYAFDRRQIAFASEIKALRPLLPGALQPDLSQLAWFLHYGRVYNAPRTFFEGVRELPGGHALIVEDGVVGEPAAYWDIDLGRVRATYDYANPEAELLRLLRDAVRLRLRSDVPVGTCLSGGLDSSAIVAIATGQLRETDPAGRMNSFSTIYPVRGMDEGRYIRLVGDQYGTQGHTVTPDAVGYLERLERITWHQDIPTGTTGVYSQNFVMSLAHGVVTVLLDGQGADELFGGYLSYVVAHLRDLLQRDPLRALPQGVHFAAQVWSRFQPWFTAREFANRVAGYARHGRFSGAALTPDLAALAQARQAEDPPLVLPGADALNSLLYRALRRDSIPALLHYEDRNSMAYSIEARVPFLDHRLAEFALGIPGDLKISGAVNKVILRRALRGVVPDAVVDRRDKLGYPTPFGQWLKTDARLREGVRAIVFDGVLPRGWVERAGVEAIWERQVSGVSDSSALLHRLITAEMWTRQQASV